MTTTRKKFTACLIFIITGILYTSLSNGQIDPESVVAYWLFNETSGNIARDNSGHGYDADLKENPVWVEGKFRHALEFQGGSYLEIRNSSQNLPFGASAPFSITAWVKNQGGGTVIGKFNGGIIGAYVLTIGGGGTVSFHREVAPWSFSGSIALPDNDFGHVAVTYDGAEMKIYINGEFDSSQERGPQNTDTVTPVLIGARFTNDVPSEFFNGVLDEVALFNVALTEQQIREIMYGLSFPKASNPSPKDGAYHEDTWVSLNWSPGDSAVSHDMYLGESFNDVFDATHDSAFYQGNQTTTFYMAGFPGFAYPDGLVPGVTYYWRIDEINDVNPSSPWKGNVWSFKVPPKTAYAPDPADAAEQVAPDVTLRWREGFGSKLHTVYFGDNFDDVKNAAGGLPQGVTTYTPGPLKLAQTYYWRVDEFDMIDTYKSDVWSFTTEGAVGNPDPANGAVDVKQTPMITWSPNIFAASHELYFGTDKDAMKNADTTSPEYKGSRALGAESYDPGKLELDTTYYWRIDEANDVNPDSPWPGILWSFTTAGFLVVDDFEDYDSGDNQIWYTWKDGLGYAAYDNEPAYPGNGTGSAVGDENTPSFTEETIVHGGNQSMPFWYDNSILRYSEVEKTLSSRRDWTEEGVRVLSIWFYGVASNAAEPLYVALNGDAVVTRDNPNAAQIEEWTQWTIDLQAFADQGINLANVNSITLGLGSRTNPVAGGSGIMYFDDIRLYPPAQ